MYILPPENAKKFALKSEDSNPIIGPPRKYTDIESENYRSWPIVLQDNIQLFNASKYSHLDPEFMTNPFAQQDNGLLSICYSHKFLMPVAIDAMLNGAAGDWCANEHVHLQQAVAFVLIPGEFTYGPSPPSSRNPSVTSNYTSSLKGYLSVSGEAVPYAPIKVEVLPGAISLISAPWQQSDRWEAEWRAKHPQK